MRLLLISCTFLCLLTAGETSSQNLVINGGFERQTPKTSGKLQAKPVTCQFAGNANVVNTSAYGWQTFDSQTPDLLVWDSLAECRLIPGPHSGSRMMGLIMYHPFQDAQFSFDYHEFVQGVLSRPLEKGKIYRVSFWVSTNDSLGILHLLRVFGRAPAITAVQCGNFGLLFSKGKILKSEEFMRSQSEYPVRPQLNWEKVIPADGAWHQLRFSFRADDAYKYFLVGNFYSDAVTNTNLSTEERARVDEQNRQAKSFWEKTKRIAYYCFDDFVIEEDGGATMETSLRETKKFTFSSELLFDSGASELKPAARDAVLQLAEVLKKNPELKIEIGGHTDNVGDDAHNKTLSEQRAQAVYQVLIEQGIPADRLSWKGYGERRPVASNDTAAGRQKNRRVECSVVE
ncbi:MAG: OmpA family protein [Saprospiraceae bacterium]